MKKLSSPRNRRRQRNVNCSNIRYWSPENPVLFHTPPLCNIEVGACCAPSAIWIDGPVSSENIN